MDWGMVRQTVDDVVYALRFGADGSRPFIPRASWPAACCEQTAVAMAGVLEDRGLGEWHFVSAGRPGELSSHAWIELCDESGDAVFSIDPTLHQFPEWDEPYVGEGPTPARAVFVDLRWRGRFADWPYLGDERDVFLVGLREVRKYLAGVESGPLIE